MLATTENTMQTAAKDRCPRCNSTQIRMYTVPSQYSREAEFTCEPCNAKKPRTPWGTYIPVTFYLPVR